MERDQMFMYFVGAGLVKLAIHYLAPRAARPAHARVVGRVKSMWIYPVKSVRGLALRAGECTFSGLRAKGCMDRQWMVVWAADGRAVTARDFPRLLTMAPSLREDGLLHLAAPGRDTLVLPAPGGGGNGGDTLTVYNTDGSAVTGAVDCGPTAATWLETALGRPPGTFKLVYNPLVIKEEEEEADESFWPAERQPPNKTHFHQNFSFMMTSSSSLADLNQRITERHKVNFTIPALQFRPNLEIDGADPYAEDNWKDIWIGESAKFSATKLCDRCQFTLINPETGEKCKEGEPLVTLRKYRPLNEIRLSGAASGPYNIGPSSVGTRPTFGMNYVLSHPGNIAVGDPVYATT